MTDWLIDKSALWKLPQSADYELWVDCVNRRKVVGGIADLVGSGGVRTEPGALTDAYPR